MKLHRRTFQVFWDVHAWASVVGALFLYVMFFAAAFALFYPQLDDWAEPVQAGGEPGIPALQPVFEQLLRDEPGLEQASIGFSLEDHTLSVDVRGAGERKQFRYSAQSERLELRKSELGSFLYQLHYLGPLPWGIYLAGFSSMALFLSLVTGFLIHLKDLVRQWSQFRPDRPVRTWASDMHKVFGVFGLPFQLLYAWSGAVLCLGFVTVVPVFDRAVFGGNEHAALAARGESPLPSESHGKGRALLNLDDLMSRARAAVPELEPSYLWLEQPRDAFARVTVYGKVGNEAFGNAEVVLRGSDGELLRVNEPKRANSLQRFEAWLFGLHFAEFGGYGVKWFYALLSLLTCAVIITGNWVWLERRDRKRARLGNRILQRLTVGTCAGVPLAVSALFAANRTLPMTLARRSTFEQAIFGGVFAAALLWPLIARADRKVAVQQLLLSSTLFVWALGLDLAQRPLVTSSAAQRGVNLALFCLALLCAATGLRLARGRHDERLTTEPAGSS